VAFYQLQSEKATKPSKEKQVGIVLLIGISLAFLFLFTNLVPFMKTFLLGVFGLFAYPLSITMFFVAIALINNKKYVMSKRYLLFLSMCTVSFLCIVQLAILGKPNMGFFEYLGHSYTFSLTAGGILISLLTAPVIYLLDLLAGYIFFVLAFMISVALLVDYLYYLKKNIQLQNPFMIFSKKQKVAPATPEQKTASAINHQNLLAKFEKKEQVKLTLDAKLESEEKENQAKIKLGVIAGNMNHKPTMANPQNKYEYIMTPPQIDLAHYSKTRQTNEQRILQTFENLKH
jgi:hypothetical protein